MLTQYRVKYRNDHFHKDNVHRIAEIEEIREQTLLVFALLLGGCNLSKDAVQGFQPFYENEERPQTLQYSDVEKWLDAILGGDNLLNPDVPIYFMMENGRTNRWQLRFCTVNGFIDDKYPNEQGNPYVCDPLMWPDILEKDEAEKEMISFICKYLQEGKYSIKLKNHKNVRAGFLGRPQLLYERN